MSLSRETVESLIFGKDHARRFTQDSPVLPDVWIRFGAEPEADLDLLLTPHRETPAGRLARELRRRLEEDRGPEAVRKAEIAYTRSTVLARLSFEELVRVALPMTSWWRRKVRPPEGVENKAPLSRERLLKEVEALRSLRDGESMVTQLSSDVLWMTEVVGSIAWSRGKDPAAGGEEAEPSVEEVVDAVLDLFGDPGLPESSDTEAEIYLIQRNRPAIIAVRDSVPAIKADAARLLFDIHCRDLAWAVVDSGIDATHPAFRRLEPGGEPFPQAFSEDENHTRIEATYDFTRLRWLMNPDHVDLLAGAGEPPKEEPAATFIRRISASPRREEIVDQLDLLKRSLLTGREVDWELLEPMLRVPHDAEYDGSQAGDHGTHVAGILAGDWRNPAEPSGPRFAGVCPDLRLYDLRVVERTGAGDEFSVVAALQFLRHLNSRSEHIVVHGANLSLSIEHDVANYACGRTPVCEEAERLMGSGVMVVAAAGNRGHLRYLTAQGEREGYHTISITDPGNAEKVLTVGATHRSHPHTYGVSYFSSRGPTGDGRRKPDLVAPGEKILGPVPGSSQGVQGATALKDGTSMATPHVSGAAALLMARHREMVGRPDEIKRVLVESATDLGRERYFQGAGMLDVLRALQAL